MATSASAKGDALMSEADRKMNGGGLFSSIFGSKKDKAREAAELLDKAGNSYKLDKAWSQAGNAFEKAAEHFLLSEDTHDAARRYSEAANCYQKSDELTIQVRIQGAVRCLNKALEIYVDGGRFGIAAKAEADIADIYEGEGNLAAAAEHNQKAADFYEMENQKANRDKYLLKVAHANGSIGKFLEASKIFEQVGTACVEDALRKFSAREHFMKAGLCLLAAGDVVGAKNALNTYASISFDWKDSRECRLLNDVVAAVDKVHEGDFENAVREYDSFVRLDQWKTSILVKVKDTIKAHGDSEIM